MTRKKGKTNFEGKKEGVHDPEAVTAGCDMYGTYS